MKILTRTGATIAGALMMAGCAAPYSEAPLATNFPTTSQEKLQAAAHWDAVATDLAKEILTALPTPLTGNLYVSARQESPFTQAMKEQLTTAMVRSGYPVAKQPEGLSGLRSIPKSWNFRKAVHKTNGSVFPPHWSPARGRCAR